MPMRWFALMPPHPPYIVESCIDMAIIKCVLYSEQERHNHRQDGAHFSFKCALEMHARGLLEEHLQETALLAIARYGRGIWRLWDTCDYD
jgi:hypothetical protein